MKISLNFAGHSVLVNGAGPRISIDGATGALVDDDRIASPANRAERPCPIPHYAPAPAGYLSIPSRA